MVNTDLKKMPDWVFDEFATVFANRKIALATVSKLNKVSKSKGLKIRFKLKSRKSKNRYIKKVYIIKIKR